MRKPDPAQFSPLAVAAAICQLSPPSLPPTTANPAASSQATITTQLQPCPNLTHLHPRSMPPRFSRPRRRLVYLRQRRPNRRPIRRPSAPSHPRPAAAALSLVSPTNPGRRLHRRRHPPSPFPKNAEDLNGDPIAVYPTFSSDKRARPATPPSAKTNTPRRTLQLYLAPTSPPIPIGPPIPTPTTNFTGWSAPGNGPGQVYNYNDKVCSTAFYETDSNGNLILDSKGLPIYNPSWHERQFTTPSALAPLGTAIASSPLALITSPSPPVASSSSSPRKDAYAPGHPRAPVNFDYTAPGRPNQIPHRPRHLPVLRRPFHQLLSAVFSNSMSPRPPSKPKPRHPHRLLQHDLNATTLVVTNGGNYEAGLPGRHLPGSPHPH